MTRVAVLQSNYIPWKGYFDIISRVDTFVFYDDVQYTKHDWRNRNRIKTKSGLQWLTIPTGSSIDRHISEVELKDGRWQQKHWKSILQTYSQCRYFKVYRSFLEEVYLGRTWTHLSELNRFLIQKISHSFLQLDTQFRNSYEFHLSGRNSDRLLDLLQQIGTDIYVSGPSAHSYIDANAFLREGIEVQYMDYQDYPEYPQHHPPFIHEVSILDLLFHVGPTAQQHISRRSAAA